MEKAVCSTIGNFYEFVQILKGSVAMTGRKSKTNRDNLPRLTESHIRDMADPQSFERGRNYYNDGAIIDPVRQGMELRGECSGSRYQPYRVRVRFSDKGIVEASCTCPRGGFCKHIVALLLAYVHEPESFRELAPLEEMLARLSKEELISLISEMIEREPSLLVLVELSASAARGHVDAASCRRQALRVLRHEDPLLIEADLRGMLNMAERMAAKEDWFGAGTVCHALLSVLSSEYEDIQFMDEEGDIAVVAGDCAELLGECLAQGRVDARTRREWLQTLLEAELADIRLGGIDFASGAFDVILEHATEEEWAVLEERIREAMEESNEWKKEMLVRMLVSWREKHGRHEEAGDIIRELGTPEQRMLWLVRDGKPAEAVAIARQHCLDKPGLITRLAGELVEAGAREQAVTLLTELAQGADSHWSYVEWLAEYYRVHGDWGAALKWQRRVFLQNPRVKSFIDLEYIGKKLGVWEQVRSEVLHTPEIEKKPHVLLEIALHEGDVARALELLPRASGWGWRNYKERVAGAAEKERPEDAIALYKELVEEAIGRRQRGAYREAAGYLCRIKTLCQRTGAQEDWEDYFAALRRKYARFPALQEELNGAGL
ncbi:SWIM zinc finger family protein [Desulfofundulus thermocisternus]|nr:SWIM zinc finger family protein [Desulfofundulus thermocisternus]